jgi:hypothetical protein
VRNLLGATLVALASAVATAAVAQVDYTSPEQRNPQNDPTLEEKFQEHQTQHGRGGKPSTDRGSSTDTTRNMGREWLEQQLQGDRPRVIRSW